jgi:predicted ArsR family transcriptional regulator
MRWWETSIGGAVRGRIIALLRRSERSVEELASELDVTDNAVRAQLQGLERHGVVHQARIRREGTVGKPAVMYGIAPDAESLFSSAYAPVLKALLVSLEERLDGPELDAVFRDAGRRLAEEMTRLACVPRRRFSRRLAPRSMSRPDRTGMCCAVLRARCRMPSVRSQRCVTR